MTLRYKVRRALAGIICRLRGHDPKPDGDGYHYCGRCKETVLYEEDGWRL